MSETPLPQPLSGNPQHIAAVQKVLQQLGPRRGIATPSVEAMELVRKGQQLWAELRSRIQEPLDLAGGQFTELMVIGLDLSGANLTGANFTKCLIRGTDFSGANLAGASFVETILELVDFSEAQCARVNFRGTFVMFEVLSYRAEFKGFRRIEHIAYLKRSVLFNRANLSGACFHKASLGYTDFSGVRAVGADFSNANFLGDVLADVNSDFTKANFAGASGLKVSPMADKNSPQVAQKKALLDRLNPAQQAQLSRCFIATVASGGAGAEEVVTLRRFRNELLWHSPAGRWLIGVYCRFSPLLAERLADCPCLCRAVRCLIVHPAARLAAFAMRCFC